MTENAIAKEIVDAAFRIHTTLGPGLLESVYQTVLAYELGRRGLRAVSRQAIPVVYEGIRIDTGPIWWSKTRLSWKSSPSRCSTRSTGSNF